MPRAFSRAAAPVFSAVVALAAALGACDRPPSQPPTAPPAAATADDVAATAGRIDAHLAESWRAAGVTPAAAADDATFLRRASLDLTGTLPDATSTRAFLDDARPDKRARLVAALVQSDGWARHWANYWDETLMGGLDKGRFVDRIAFRQWLYQRLGSGTRYDALVSELVTASGVNSAGGRPDPAAWELSPGSAPPEDVSGAVNWLLRGAREPQDIAGGAARVFLGVRIQCAQCHDHPFERWTQQDFRRFTAAFMRIDGKPLDDAKEKGIRRIEIRDADGASRRMRRRMEKTGFDDAAPAALDGTSLEGPSPRAKLAQWMTDADNPYFARALVNRVWSVLLGSGFVEPIDDFRTQQEVVAPEVLAALSQDFVAHGYDLRRLMQIVCATQAYGRASAGAEPKAWSRFELRPMTDTQLLDAVVGSSGLGPVLEEVAGERIGQLKFRLRRELRFTFEVDEESVEDTYSGTVPQALTLLNGPVVAAASSALEGSTVGRAAALSDAAAIETLYLSILSRRPAADELGHWQRFLAAAPAVDRERVRAEGPLARVYRKKKIAALGAREHALEDVAWALYSSSEFFFIH